MSFKRFYTKSQSQRHPDMIQQNDLPPNDFAANPLYFAAKRLCCETTSKLRNSQGHPTTVFFIKTRQNGIAVGLVYKRTKTCVIGPLLGRSECKLTEKDQWPLKAKQLSLVAATHRTVRVIWLCEYACFVAKPRVGLRESVLLVS